jgi:hypothetical protein
MEKEKMNSSKDGEGKIERKRPKGNSGELGMFASITGRHHQLFLVPELLATQ